MRWKLLLPAMRRDWAGSSTTCSAWPDSMRLYVNPIIGELPIAAVDTPAVLRVLEPMWHTKTKTAMNVRGRIFAMRPGLLKTREVRTWRS